MSSTDSRRSSLTKTIMQNSVLAVSLLGSLGIAGCSGHASGNAGAVSINENQSAHATAVAAAPITPSAQAIKVRRGAAPITYVVAGGGHLYVRDITADKWLVESRLAPGSVVTIDTQKGIYTTQRALLSGPLPTGEQFELWLDITRKN